MIGLYVVDQLGNFWAPGTAPASMVGSVDFSQISLAVASDGWIKLVISYEVVDLL